MDNQTHPRWKMPCVWFALVSVFFTSCAQALTTADFIPDKYHRPILWLVLWIVTFLGAAGSILFPGFNFQSGIQPGKDNK